MASMVQGIHVINTVAICTKAYTSTVQIGQCKYLMRNAVIVKHHECTYPIIDFIDDSNERPCMH